MQLISACLNALKYRGKTAILAFSYNNVCVTCLLQKCVALWESTDEPSLKAFLEFRLKTNDLKDKDTEHRRYKIELEIIKHHHDKNSEIGAKLRLVGAHIIKYCSTLSTTMLVVTGDGKGCNLLMRVCRHFNGLPCWLRLVSGKNDKLSDQVNYFWDLQVKRKNTLAEINLFCMRSELNEKKQDDLRDQICIEQTRHVLDATRETRSQSTLLQKTITKRRLLNESHERTYNEEGQSGKNDDQTNRDSHIKRAKKIDDFFSVLPHPSQNQQPRTPPYQIYSLSASMSPWNKECDNEGSYGQSPPYN
ncbi:3386_t:CDS:2, partial [Funneliformis mosseae]